MLKGELPAPRPEGDAGYADELRARRALAAAGLHEVMTYSVVDPALAGRMSVASDGEADVDSPIRIANPQSTEASVLRTSLLGSLMTPLRTNLRQRDRVLIFELARTWHGELNPLPDERRHVGIAMTGPRAQAYWSAGREALDFYDLKGAVEALCSAFGVSATYEPTRHTSLHPGRTAAVMAAGQRLGVIGQLHPTIAERFDLDREHPVLVGELDFERVLQVRQPLLSVATPSRFPPADRDVSFFVPADVPHAALESAIREAAGPLLEHVRLFDVYAAPPAADGRQRRSMAYSLRYRSSDRTLGDDEVSAAHARVEDALRERFGGEVRGR
jgi:phenylalanyl-tRNA synthetase beta chain